MFADSCGANIKNQKDNLKFKTFYFSFFFFIFVFGFFSLLYAKNSNQSRKKLNEIIGEYRAKTNGVFDFHRFDAEDDATDLLERAGQSASLFQKKKLIVIERPSRGSEAFLKKLRLLAGVWEDDKNTIVVLWDDADKDRKST